MKKTHSNLACLKMAGFIGASFLTSPFTYAQTFWQGSLNTDWNEAANWTLGVPGSGDNIGISTTTGNGNQTVLSSNVAIGHLTFGDTGERDTEFNIRTGSNTLTINGGMTATSISTAGNKLIYNGNVTIAQNQTWNIQGTPSTTATDRGILIRGNANNAAGMGNLVLNGNLIKTGSGTLMLGNTNVTGSGNILLQGGVLKLNAGFSTPLQLGGTGQLIAESGTKIQFSKNSGTFDITRAFVMNGTSGIEIGGGVNPEAIASNITWNSGTHRLDVLTSGATINFSGVWSGSGRVDQYGANGVVVLSGQNTFSGGYYVQQGTVAATNNQAFGTGVIDLRGGIRSYDMTNLEFSNTLSISESSTYGTATTGNLKFTGTVNTGSASGSSKNINVLNQLTEFSGTLSGTTSGATSALRKTGTGTLLLSGSSTTNKLFYIDQGNLVVNGNYTSIPSFTMTGGTLSGHGSISLLTGNGYVSPGDATNPYSVFEVNQLDAGSNMLFGFDFSTPSVLSSSGNDLISLTHTTAGFASALEASNILEINFLNAEAQQTYLGGFFALQDFTSELENATFQYNGLGHFTASWSVVPYQNGFIMQFDVVPEPQKALLLLVSSTLLLARRTRKAS